MLIYVSMLGQIDHSIVESFGAGGKACMTARVYPTKAVSTAAHLFAFNNGSVPVTVGDLKAWSMRKASIN